MVVKPKNVRALGDTGYYVSATGDVYRYDAPRDGWVRVVPTSSGYYRMSNKLYNVQTLIWRAWVGPVGHGLSVRLEDPDGPMELDNLRLVRTLGGKPKKGTKAHVQREALIRNCLRRAVEAENLLLSTWAKHAKERHAGTYNGCLLLQKEYDEIVNELKELGIDYLKEREQRGPCCKP